MGGKYLRSTLQFNTAGHFTVYPFSHILSCFLDLHRCILPSVDIDDGMCSRIEHDFRLVYSDLVSISKQGRQFFERHVSRIWIPDPYDDPADEGEQNEEQIELPSGCPFKLQLAVIRDSRETRLTQKRWVHTVYRLYLPTPACSWPSYIPSNVYVWETSLPGTPIQDLQISAKIPFGFFHHLSPPFNIIVSPIWNTNSIATAARSAFSLVEGTKFATRAASTMSVLMQNHKPTAVSLFLGTLSMIGIAMRLRQVGSACQQGTQERIERLLASCVPEA
jgi:hypothetical protein